MITEDYVSFEVAKLLKEKGFDEECQMAWCYTPDKVNSEYLIIHLGCKNHILEKYNSTDTDYAVAAPTLQMAAKWLREEKNIFIVVEPHAYDYINEKNKSYVCSLWVGDNYYEYIESRDYPTYEEAVEAALKYALKNLI